MAKKLTYRAAIRSAMALRDSNDWKAAWPAFLLAADSASRYSPDRALCERLAADAFNLAYADPNGGVRLLQVRYWPMVREGEGQTGVMRGPAYMLCDSAMLPIVGVAGGIALTHIQ